jgi:hypothetical protein
VLSSSPTLACAASEKKKPLQPQGLLRPTHVDLNVLAASFHTALGERSKVTVAQGSALNTMFDVVAVEDATTGALIAEQDLKSGVVSVAKGTRTAQADAADAANDVGGRADGVAGARGAAAPATGVHVIGPAQQKLARYARVAAACRNVPPCASCVCVCVCVRVCVCVALCEQRHSRPTAGRGERR